MKRRKHKRANESQLIIPTPLWLQKRMIKNLQLAANSKVGSAHVECAKGILKAMEKVKK